MNKRFAELEPKQGFIYEFRYNGEIERFRLDYVLPDGRYQFINLKYGNNAQPMTQKRFSYKMKFHSGRIIPIEIDKDKHIKQLDMLEVRKKQTPTEQAPKSEPVRPSELRDELLKKLRALTGEEKRLFNTLSSEHVNIYISRLKVENRTSKMIEMLVAIEKVFKKLNIAL